jgi:hypothetical protein
VKIEAVSSAWGQTFIFESPPLAREILTNWAYSTGLGPWNSDQYDAFLVLLMDYSTGRAGAFRAGRMQIVSIQGQALIFDI